MADDLSSLDEVVEDLASDSGHRIVKVYREPPSPPELGPPVDELDLPGEVKLALRRRGIERLYRFQAEALASIRAGHNTVIVSGTGTGKTEAFLLPILSHVLENPFSGTVALLVYPTKALARDQLERVEDMLSTFFGARVGVLDGDTGERERQLIYESPPPILMTNPDMIHLGLMFSEPFKRILSGVKYVVLDDMHVYTGVFGAHVHYILRRLRRFLGGDVVLIGATATIGNPGEFAEALFGSKVNVVYAGGRRMGDLWYILLAPKHRSRLAEAMSLLEFCVRRGMKTLVFADSHRAAETMKRMADRLGLKVGIHRAGLLPEFRRRMEASFKTGELRAIVATPTLELGIDIGDIDAVILFNIPPTYSKLAQRAGRCGRRMGQRSYVFAILGNDPISQYYENYPDDFFARSVEPAFIEPANEEIARLHLIAAALDGPLRLDRLVDAERRVAASLIADGYLREEGGLLKATRRGVALVKRRSNIRGVGEVVRIYDAGGRLLGYREMPAALKELYPGAIYLHGGLPYLVVKFDGRRATVKRLPPGFKYVTSPLYYSEPEVFKASRSTFNVVPAEYGDISVREVVYGFIVKDFDSGAVIREALLDEEMSYTFETKGVLLRFPVNPEWGLMGNAEAFHAVEHVTITASQTVLGAGPTDMGGISFPSGHIFIYDSFPGGSGLSKLLLDCLGEVLERAVRILSMCKCTDGCPRCIYSPYCGNNNKVLSRTKALQTLSAVLEGGRAASVEEVYGKPLA